MKRIEVKELSPLESHKLNVLFIKSTISEIETSLLYDDCEELIFTVRLLDSLHLAYKVGKDEVVNIPNFTGKFWVCRHLLAPITPDELDLLTEGERTLYEALRKDNLMVVDSTSDGHILAVGIVKNVVSTLQDFGPRLGVFVKSPEYSDDRS